MDQRAQVSCGSGLWMNGSFDSGQPREATRNSAVGRQCLARVGIIFFLLPAVRNVCMSEGRN